MKKAGECRPFSFSCPVLNKVYTSHADFPES